MGQGHSSQRDLPPQAYAPSPHHSAPPATSSYPPSSAPTVSLKKFSAIPDRYRTLEEVQAALRDAGLESSNLIVGVDYTKSNESAGHNTFGGHSLHAFVPGYPNPYYQVIHILGKTLKPFDDDNLIPAFGFGDKTTSDKAVFPFFPDKPCNGFEEVLTRYNEITPSIFLAGPTSFAPIIRQAISIVQSTKQYHILIIIADGQVTPDGDYTRATSDTIQAIVDATNYPLSICCVGVGDGPWDMMEEFDDQLPQRKFDNFQFVPFHKVMTNARQGKQEIEFAVAALQEIPEQFQSIKRLDLL